MKIKRKNLYIILFAFFTFILFSTTSHAGTQKLLNLDYNVNLNSDGSAKIKETWNINISSTNTLFKTFERDSSKYSEITDVSVYELSGNEKIPLIQQPNYEYHVTKNYYYALINSDNDFEIAWGVGLDNSSAIRTYVIEYTVTDVVKKYEDCAEFYWMFLNTSNGIPANNVTGTIKLPGNVSDIENLRVWAHGPLNGEIGRTNTNTVSFSVSDLSAETMLETRVAILDTEMFSDIYRTLPSQKLDSIIKEETKWANEANLKRNSMKVLMIILAIIYLLILYYFFKKILKYNNEYKELKMKKKNMPSFEYFRDIPREKTSTPAEAAYLYYMNPKGYSLNFNSSNVLTATLMNLYLKKAIDIEQNGKNEFLIHINEKEIGLNEEERKIIALLNNVHKKEGKISTKEIKKYAQSHYTTFLSAVNSLETIAEASHIKLEHLNIENRKIKTDYEGRKNGYIALIISLFFVIPFLSFYIIPIVLEFLICIHILNKCKNSVDLLTENGLEEMAEWKGLQKYLKDYSLIKDREVFEVALWEKFLVYATAFGIADTVLKQLKIAYPEINDTYLSTNPQYHAIYMMSNTNYSFNNAINNAYKAGVTARNIATSSSSSGSGSGGGFSGGGGGGGGRRKYGRKVIYSLCELLRQKSSVPFCLRL